MGGALEVFEAAVIEDVFEVMSDKHGDAACDIVAVGLAEVVDGLSHADALEFIAPNAPRLKPEIDGGEPAQNGGQASMIVNDFWYREDTFAPIFYAVAREYYLRVRPRDYPTAPLAVLEESEGALFGCKLVDMSFEGIDACTNSGNAPLLLWAGCSAAAARFCFQTSIAMPLGYALLFDFARNTTA